MRVHPIISLLFVSACLTGCAHTQSPTAVNRLQIQVAQLEQSLDERDKSITELEGKVQSLTSQLSEMETYSLNEPVEEYDYRKVSRERVSKRRPKILQAVIKMKKFSGFPHLPGMFNRH